jgi:hypothetical protein
MAIPEFRDDGYLPMGLHKASEAEVRERFGSVNSRRIELMDRVSKWLELARVVKAHRFLVNGSFVTAKAEPNDVDCVCWLPRDFEQQYEWGRYEAVQLQSMIYLGAPKELYRAHDFDEWNLWLELFSKTREPTMTYKGIVEVQL